MWRLGGWEVRNGDWEDSHYGLLFGHLCGGVPGLLLWML